MKRLHKILIELMLTFTLVSCSPSPTAMAPKQIASDSVSSLTSPTYAPSAAPTSAPSVFPSASPSAAGTPAPSGSSRVPSVNGGVELRKTQDNFFKNYGINPFMVAKNDPLSTFAIDVDTASYSWMRSALTNNLLPGPESVRVEEYINYFDYHYPQPQTGQFSLSTELSPSPNSPATILRLGLQGKQVQTANRKDAVLTFVIDVSGSMALENRLGLVKRTLELLLKQLRTGDQVALVVFGSTARVVLEPTAIAQESNILKAIQGLQTEGATNTEEGLTLGYQLASKAFKPGAINRVILCSDGVATVGETGPEIMLNTIKQQAGAGINLSTVGFGMGNYNDILMEQLADKGDGNYAYVDNINEAYRVFVQHLTGTLQVIAKDAKIQVNFNPALVTEYRLIGYENRDVADKDFRNDKVDAGEIGSNHSVTAIYEVRLQEGVKEGKIGEVSVRYKDVDQADQSVEMNQSIQLSDRTASFGAASPSFRLAAFVAGYAELLRQSPYVAGVSLKDISNGVRGLQQQIPDETVKELAQLMDKADFLRIQTGPRTP